MTDKPPPADILAFYAEAGVDVCLADEPIDRYAESAAEVEAVERAKTERQAALAEDSTSKAGRSAPSRPSLERSRPSRAGREAPQLNVPDENAVKDAQSLAQSANTMDELRQAVEEFRGLNLAFTAKNPCFADGNPDAALMVIGEAPGRDEDIEGLPFVGRSGKLLDKILAAIGRDRTDTYISNVIYWRPPGNRKPTLHEVHVCQPFIERQIELANPRALVFAGNTPTQTLLGTKDGITRMRGRWRDYTPPGGTRAIPAMPTLHPAFLLRQPQQKRHIWNDMLAVREKLGELEAGPL